MKPELVYITLGCKVNQAESEALAAFGGNGNYQMPEGGPTVICLINTCAVTSKAAMQSRQAIRKAVRNHSGALIVVTGCYAESDAETLKTIEGVDLIVGQSDKHRIFDIIAAHCEPSNALPHAIGQPVRRMRNFEPMPAPASGNRTRPFLKIQDGCDGFCSYCIVPYTRGPNRSLDPEKVVKEFKSLIAGGAREVVLTGIHLGRYGQDLNPGCSFADLLKHIEPYAGSARIRLSSLEPTEISDELIELIYRSKNICPHFHVPLQSGDATILERMRRPYTPEAYANIIKKLHNHFPDAAIGADVLIGFPGETEEAFSNTYRLIESLPISYLHVFPFSPRPPAAAASFSNVVPPPIVKERCRIMHEAGQRKRRQFYKAMVGKTLDVIIEKRLDRKLPCVKGLSSNYIPVYIESAENLSVNTRLNSKILQACENSIIAEPLLT